MMKRTLVPKLLFSPGVAILLLIVLSFELLFLSEYENDFRLYTLDVGQGDSLLIKTPGYKYILIDGGEKSQVLSELGDVMPFWTKHIDVAIGTHSDSDHIGGLVYVLENYTVGTIYVDELDKEDQDLDRLKRTAQEHKVPMFELKTGDKLSAGDVSLLVLWPDESYIPENNNSTSITIRLTYNDFSALLTGDLEADQEELILRKGYNLQSDVLKVGHHGSKTSTSDKFLLSVMPQLSIISCGKDNKFGHPDSEVLTRLGQVDEYILRTDVDGRIMVRCVLNQCVTRK